MYPMRSSRFLLRLGASLVLGAGCIASWMVVTSYSASQPLAQSPPTDSPPTLAEAARFLQQSTWGPTWNSIMQVQQVGYDRFLEDQFNAAPTGYPTLPLVPGTPADDCPASTVCRRDNYTLYPVQTRFFTNALYGEDQLRQRVAFALHQIFVVNGVDIGQGYPSRLTPYLQVLHRDGGD